MPARPRSQNRPPGLVYVSDAVAGITRRGQAGAFTYHWPSGRRVRDAATLRRIQSLAIPPAWTAVWIATGASGHMQATGRDARGRKQYRYHLRWRLVRDAAKFDHLLEFARVLPAIRAAVARDLRAPPASRAHVLAVVVSLLERTHMRIGNDEYARANDSYGLTTLKNRHARVLGRRVEFRFKGKSGIVHHVSVDDPRLARDVRRCQELPGQTLFEYLDEDGRCRSLGSADVNRYLADVSGTAVTAKDFRTWWGTISAARRLRATEPPRTKAEARRATLAAIDSVASELGNTRAVCRSCYIHPAVLAGFNVGSLKPGALPARTDGLTEDEAWLVAFLERSATQPSPRGSRQKRQSRPPDVAA
jgi:DNA topoisomerase-1